MPYEFVLPQVPMGVAVQTATGQEGALTPIAIREFTSSEDGEEFIRRLEGLPNQLLASVSPVVNPSTIDHLVAIIAPGGSTRLYVNECNVFIRARPSRSLKKGEAMFEGDLVDINSLVFEGVEFPLDAGVVCVFSAGWRKGLFFDLGPLGPDPQPRSYDVPALLGSYMAYLRSQGVFHLVEEDWNYLIAHQWFPFISLPPQFRAKLVAFAKERQELNRLLPDAMTTVRQALPKMLERWRSSDLFRPHIDLLTHAAKRFEEGDYVSCTAIVYPRIEGLMRTLRLAIGTGDKANQKNLTATLIDARQHEHHDFNLLVPEMFRRYLGEVYFASFEPGQPSPLSRNSVGHGVASVEQFDEKGAVLGLLTLDQLYFFLPA